MSEQQFVLKFDTQENEYFIRDNSEEEEELGSYTLKWGVKKLNEQQATIYDLQIKNNHLIDVVKEYADKYSEQQSIIEQQEVRLRQLEELLELSENLKEEYKKRLVDINLKEGD